MDRRSFIAASAGMITAPTQAVSTDPLAVFLAAELAGTDFGGTILVARSGKVMLRAGFGTADRSFAVPCASNTAYRIASITKLMTATIVMQLVDTGRIALEQPIAAYLLAYKGPAANKVRIGQLLNHTSGIENFDKALGTFADAKVKGMPLYQLPHTPRQLLDRFASGPLVSEPGKTFDYNNADYVILGQIIEEVERQSFEAVLARRLLLPLGLTNITMASSTRIIPRLARTYYKEGALPLTPDMPVYVENWYAAGGLCSTADDLLVFADALYGGRLVSGGSLRKLLTPGLDNYGFGQWVSTLKVDGRYHAFAQRPGRIMGTNTLLLRMLDDDVTIVILGNTNLVDTDKLGLGLARRVLTT